MDNGRPPDNVVRRTDATRTDAPPAAAARPDLREAAALRDRHFGAVLTWSPKVFLPLTRLCRNRCDYCSFRRNPRDPGAHTMTPDELEAQLEQASAAGCVEALLCLGDEPETAYPSYRRLLAGWGFDSTVDYLAHAAERALAHGLLPHTNAGVLSRCQMRQLRPLNVSLGLMLESVADRLCAPGMPHHRAPDKRPARRIAMHTEAGELKIPFTTGLLIGLGETWQERVDTVAEIRRQHERHGHIQEVIIQNLRAHPQTAMAAAPEPLPVDVAETVAMARLMLPTEISVQAPPNLNPGAIELLIDAGINDFGGISAVTPDFINPLHPWPHIEELRERCATKGFALRPRLPVYERYLDGAAGDDWLDDRLTRPVQAVRHRQKDAQKDAQGTPLERHVADRY